MSEFRHGKAYINQKGPHPNGGTGTTKRVEPGVFVQDSDFTLHVGDALEVLAGLPDESVHCVVTSPPYWGLRDYSTEGQMGLEATPDEFVACMVDVFREVRRVLRRDGTCWVNLGDSYNSRLDGSHGGWNGSSKTPQTVDQRGPTNAWSGSVRRLAQKNLMGLPWRVAFALQEDGWILRSDIVWSKPNPMPESVTDRPTKAHEYVFLLTKSPRYFFDQEAVREPHSPDGRKVTVAVGRENSLQHRDGERWPNGGRNVRSVWEIATQPYPEAHFATFPEALPERCIRAGTSERGCCPVCGAPWERVVERGELVHTGPDDKRHKNPLTWSRSDARRDLDASDHGTARALAGNIPNHAYERIERGWQPTCDHLSAVGLDVGMVPFEPVPCTVLDPFMGSGTTALVARRLGRRSIGIELNQEYAELCARRLQQLSLLA